MLINNDKRNNDQLVLENINESIIYIKVAYLFHTSKVHSTPYLYVINQSEEIEISTGMKHPKELSLMLIDGRFQSNHLKRHEGNQLVMQIPHCLQE